jgi:hypothetical protein
MQASTFRCPAQRVKARVQRAMRDAVRACERFPHPNRTRRLTIARPFRATWHAKSRLAQVFSRRRIDPQFSGGHLRLWENHHQGPRPIFSRSRATRVLLRQITAPGPCEPQVRFDSKRWPNGLREGPAAAVQGSRAASARLLPADPAIQASGQVAAWRTAA